MKRKARPLCPTRVRLALNYNDATGEFTWRERNLWEFATDRAGRVFNSQFAGKRAGYSGSRGYRYINLLGQMYAEHRLAWACATGRWPDCVDHINGDVADNRFANLRNVSQQQNVKNARMRRTNTSGHVGVRWSARSGKWIAEIGHDGKTRHLGLFLHLEEALAARADAEEKYGFHPNHGRKRGAA